MRNGKDILRSEPVVVRLTLVSLTPSGIVQAEALIRSTEGLAVLEVEGWSDLSQTSRLSAPSSGAVSALGYRLAEIGSLVEVRLQRCLASLPGKPGQEAGDE